MMRLRTSNHGLKLDMNVMEHVSILDIRLRSEACVGISNFFGTENMTEQETLAFCSVKKNQ